MPDRIVRLLIAYDGTNFRGWAAQRDRRVRTVESVITSHLERLAGERVELAVAGRTDAGVHARGQVASFQTASDIPLSGIQAALNDALSPEVVIGEARFAPAGFDARFSATGRVYTYRISTASTDDPFAGRFVWHRPGPLGLVEMRAAAAALIGEHDFASFCRHPGPSRSTIRRLERVSIRKEGDLLMFTFEANAFLHQMVRSLVAALVDVGDGRSSSERMAEILAARHRAASRGRLAPPHGLTLERVRYGRGGRSYGLSDE